MFAVAVPVPPLAPGQPWMSLNASGPAFLFTEQAMREQIAPPLLALVNSLSTRAG